MCTLGGKCRAETKTVFVQFIMGHSPVTALLPPSLSAVASSRTERWGEPPPPLLRFLIIPPLRPVSVGGSSPPSLSLSSPTSSRAWGCSCETRSCGGGLCHMANEEDDDFLTHFSQSLSWICCNQSQSSPIPLTLSLLTPLPLKHDCKLECRGRRTDGRLLTLRAAARLTRKDQHRNPFFPIPSPRPFSAFVVCPGAARRPESRQRKEGVAGDTARGLRSCGGG